MLEVPVYDVYVEDAPTIERHHNETEQSLERDRPYEEEVAGGCIGNVVAQERLPGLVRLRRAMCDNAIVARRGAGNYHSVMRTVSAASPAVENSCSYFCS